MSMTTIGISSNLRLQNLPDYLAQKFIRENSFENPKFSQLERMGFYTGDTDPCFSNEGLALPGNKIVIGGGPSKGPLAGQEFFEQLMDWEAEDCHVHDEYLVSHIEDGDVYEHFDNFDASRDLIAFYSRDGFDLGEFYFRVDLSGIGKLIDVSY